ncbi:unnamed protein product [Cyprideis torosa]|uniref:Uncharacterized protein n=1 Tax=Cyprideis torosa TaxID=163714 RepID=A0A7R8WZI8_9CRUS|nr:unnamed protein product [Cyprideis torosa]CAG0910024.1 unnamed protein product [Cyprideis torosa]
MDKSRDTVLPVLCEVEPRAKCPAQFTAVGDTCYHLGFSSTTWDLAQDYCHSLAPNGKLIELETLEEIYLVTEFLNNNSDPSREYWAGAEDREGHDGFYWASSDKPVVITNWWSGITFDKDKDDAVHLGRGDNHGWRWNDNPKSTSRYELCEANPADL